MAQPRPEPIVTAERLRGRRAEVSMICDRLDQLLLGHGGLVVIRGPAGIGKSALLTAAESAARAHDIRVFHGSGSPTGQTVPLAPLLEALVSPDDPPVSPKVLRELSGSPDQRFWVLQELESGLEIAAHAGPLVIGIDDLQWADAASLTAVASLPRRLAAHQILWIFVVRSGRLDAAVDNALTRMRALDPDLLDLRRLDEHAVQEISEDLLGRLRIRSYAKRSARRSDIRSYWWSCCAACTTRDSSTSTETSLVSHAPGFPCVCGNRSSASSTAFPSGPATS